MINQNSVVKSVDFKIRASGYGVVNWNGASKMRNPVANDFVSNHSLPKLIGLDLLQVRSIDHEDFKKAKLFVSSNCIRNALFKNETYNLKEVTPSNVANVLSNVLGLVRGYVITKGGLSLKRKTALRLEDFIDHHSTGRYEQFSNAGERTENSIFSKFNFDATTYESFGTFDLEEMQFLPLEDFLGRGCYAQVVRVEEGEALAKSISAYLKSIDKKGRNPSAQFNVNYVRIGSIEEIGEAGILLNDDALDILIDEIIERIAGLMIKQSKGYLRVDKITVDYNDSSTDRMRIKRNETEINPSKTGEYEVYYKPVELSKALKAQKDKQIEEYSKKSKNSKKTDKSAEPASEKPNE